MSHAVSAPVATHPGGAQPANRLLAALTRTERARLAEALTPVTLQRGQTLVARGEEIQRLILPDSGLVGLVLELPDGTSAEVGVVGRDGVVGLSALFGEAISPFRAVVRVPGTAHVLPAAELRLLAERSAHLRELLRRHAMAALLQAATAATCYATHPLERRAARWLLAAADRVGPGFPLTQDDLAASLGARRPTVNGVLAGFRRAGLIRHARGRVAVADRAGLEARACACHGTLHAALARLLRGATPAAQGPRAAGGIPSDG